MARPTIFEYPMTAAERMRRYRERKQDGAQRPPTVREGAAKYRVSERLIYYFKAWQRESLIEWHPNGFKAFLDRHAGTELRPLSLTFLAEVCRYGDAKMQRKVRDRINKAGISAGHVLWRELRPDLVKHKRQKRKDAKWRKGMSLAGHVLD